MGQIGHVTTLSSMNPICVKVFEGMQCHWGIFLLSTYHFSGVMGSNNHFSGVMVGSNNHFSGVMVGANNHFKQKTINLVFASSPLSMIMCPK